MDPKRRVPSHIRVSSFGAPCSVEQVEAAERELGQPLPEVLREFYLAFNGFSGADGVHLWPLDGSDGLVRFNLFFRGADYAPSWAEEAVFFGCDGIGGTPGAMWAIRPAAPSEVIEWGFQDGEDRHVAGSDVLQVWARRQREYDENTRARDAGGLEKGPEDSR